MSHRIFIKPIMSKIPVEHGIYISVKTVITTIIIVLLKKY